MALKKIEQVKSDRGFKIWDLIIYGVIAVIAAVAFIVVFTTRSTSPLTGVRIYVAGEVVFVYEFGSSLTATAEGVEAEEDASGITVKITQSGGDFNEIYIDKSAKTVKMKDANCKGKHCMYFPAIDDNNKMIYCNPHRIRIEPFAVDYDSPDLIM